MNTDLKQRLLNVGFIYPVMNGIQIDLNARWKREEGGGWKQASQCDHNCTSTKGKYTCPAAISLNRGIVAASYPPPDEVIGWIDTAVAGLKLARDRFLRDRFDAHCEKFEIPVDVRTLLREAELSDKVEINLFGGNPELYPHVLAVIKVLKARGHIVNLTTTGKRIMREKHFLGGFLETPPDVLAMSSDDYDDLSDIKSLMSMELGDIQRDWDAIEKDFGQRQKALESVYVSKLAAKTPGFPRLLFNMVLHKGNIMQAREIMACLTEALPNTIVNPYPIQLAFNGKTDFFNTSELAELEKLIDSFIERTVQGSWLVRRLQYWLMYKAVFETWRHDPATLTRKVVGYDLWKCYAEDAGMYMQIGRSSRIVQQMERPTESPGGHGSCFWDADAGATVTDHDRKIENPEQVADYLSGGMRQLSLGSKTPCAGCGMPRLVFNLRNTQAGMSPELIPAFIGLRKKYVGF